MSHVQLNVRSRDFQAAAKALKGGRLDPRNVAILKGGITDEVRHIEPLIDRVALVLRKAMEDGIDNRSRFAYILRRDFGFFIPGRLISKAINRIHHQDAITNESVVT